MIIKKRFLSSEKCKLTADNCKMAPNVMLVDDPQIPSVVQKVLSVSSKTPDVSLKSLVAADKSMGTTD